MINKNYRKIAAAYQLLAIWKYANIISGCVRMSKAMQALFLNASCPDNFDCSPGFRIKILAKSNRKPICWREVIDFRDQNSRMTFFRPILFMVYMLIS